MGFRAGVTDVVDIGARVQHEACEAFIAFRGSPLKGCEPVLVFDGRFAEDVEEKVGEAAGGEEEGVDIAGALEGASYV